VDFLLKRRLALKITVVYAEEKINAEMKSLSFHCVKGRGQPMPAAKRGDMESKKSTNKKGGPLAIYSFFKILYISC
jgi:hypothetical protein